MGGVASITIRLRGRHPHCHRPSHRRAAAAGPLAASALRWVGSEILPSSIDVNVILVNVNVKEYDSHNVPPPLRRPNLSASEQARCLHTVTAAYGGGAPPVGMLRTLGNLGVERL